MDNQVLITRDVRSIDVSTINIISNDQKTNQDIKNVWTDIYYYESVLQETIRTSVMYVDAGTSVEKDGKQKTILEGLPIVGQEKVLLKIKDANNIELKLTLYVNKITPVKQDTTKSFVGLDLVSKEGILNHQIRINSRFDGKISDHITRIIKTESKYLNTEKNIDIEETNNNYNFIGNNKKPFYAAIWLSKKAVPKGIQPGNTAGYFLYETSDGFKFKSIDGLLSDTDPKTGSKKQIKRLIYNQTPDGSGKNIPDQYNAKILEHNVDDISGNVQTKLEIGTYSTKTILFDPFNCYYEVVLPKSEVTEKNLQLAGKELPKFNPEFKTNFTRTQYMMIDTGTLPTGDTKQQIEKSKEQNFDPKNILNQSTMRYNQLFSTRTTITIVADFSLHAGDLVFIDAGVPGQELGTLHSGLYLIADLCHYINKSQGGYTKLTLVRDSIGKKGSPAYSAI
jgi:hypothetical protein